jgi:Stress responsive A/B Barrel Domain
MIGGRHMYSHVVLYKSFRGNPQAATMILFEAERLLSQIPGIKALDTGLVIDNGRAVGNISYDVMLNIIFYSAKDYEQYMKHPWHVAFVRFVLRGYILKDSQAGDPETEFIDYVLNGGVPCEWVRNPAISDNNVVWDGEMVFDAM